ncbi:hypothetical protein C2S52_013022 [Perilla frutescens var. hirtella]|nr:hypothetical protein C2S52_013022 [Perilla frutescens var. hirtella]
MGKKSSQSSPTKISKHEKKPHLNTNLMKILRPKVYITDTCNFKRLVQELTGNRQYPPLESSPPPPTTVPLSPPAWEVPFVETSYQDFDHNIYQDNNNYMSSCNDVVSFGSSSSPDLSVTASLSREFEESEKMEFYRGLESMLMEMDSGSSDYDACYDQMFRQDHDQVCVYDYDLSNFV